MSKGRKITIAAIASVIILGIGGIFLVPKIMNVNKDKKLKNTEESTYSEFNENNIGELYYSPIDPEHIAEDESGVMYSDNEILVVADEGVSFSEIEDLAVEYNAEIVGYIEQTGDYQWKFSNTMTKSQLSDTINDIQSNEIIDTAYKNLLFDIEDNSVDYNIKTGDNWVADPLSQTGKYFQDTKAWGVQTINAPFAWTVMNVNKENITPIKVGLLDNVFDADHEDLGFAELFYNDSSKAGFKDEKYHGTHVAGTFAAKGSNDKGICGVYPYGDGNLYGVSVDGVCDYYENNVNAAAEGEKTIRILSIMELKIGYAELILRDVKVINVSLGFNWKNLYKDKFITIETFDYKKIKELYESDFSVWEEMSNTLGEFLDRTIKLGYDFIIVSAAGNDSDTSIGHLESKYSSWNNMISAKDYPEVYNRIIVVGSIDEWYDVFADEESISSFSNAGNRVDIFAPGETIYSTMPNDKYDNSYELSGISGTSMASPHVAGVCANVWSIDNSLKGPDVKKIVCSSVLEDNYFYTCPDNENEKRGVVDCYKAVMTALNERSDSSVQTDINNGAALGWINESDRETPIEDVTIIPYQNDNALEDYVAATDEYGHFELIVPGGDYEIHFSKEGYTEKILGCTVKNGEVNYFNEGIDEVISLDKEITQAEKYAKIVMDNENLWLDPLNEMQLSENESQICWFEDVNFDEKPEFIVGGCNMQSQGGISYYIFKFEDDKMVKLYDDYIDKANANSGISSTGNIPSQLRRPDPGFAEYSAEIIKDKNGRYRYIFPYIVSYLGTGYGIAELNIEGDILNWDLVGGYVTDPEFEYINSSGNSVSESELRSSFADWFEGSSFCFAEIGTIPCTYVNEDLDSEWYKAAASSDPGLSDAASAYVSGCYDGLSKEDKKAALIKSYNSYNIKEVGGDSQLYGQILRDMQDDVWKTAYWNYISQGEYKNLTNGFLYGDEIERITADDAKFTLAYLDSDDIPELFVSGGYSVHILTIKDGKLAEIITNDEYGNIGWYGGVKIVEKEGLFLDDYQRMGTYTTPVYKMVNGKAELHSDIAYYENQDGSGAGTFYVNNEEVSKSIYLAELKKYNLNTYYTEQHPESKITGDNWTYISTNDGYGIFDDYSIYEFIRNY